MLRFAIGALVALSLAASAQAAVTQAAEVAGMQAAAAAVQQQAPDAKRVSPTDSGIADITGTVNVVYDLGSVCGIRSYLVYINVRSAIWYPLAAVCAGPTLASCGALHPGQRARIRGVLASVPDATTAGFNPCDRDTWQYVTPALALGVTQVLR